MKNRPNLWLSRAVSFAYLYQREARPYKQLVDDFSSLFEAYDNDRVLDIGCGSGRLMELVLEKSGGRIRSITGIDGSVSALGYAKMNLANRADRNVKIELSQADISESLPFEEGSFDLVTSGLCLQYAEHWDGARWTDRAYRRIFRDIFKVLSPGGRLVFSANTPEPDFSVIARDSWREIFLSWKMPYYAVIGGILVAHGRYLAKQARTGRYHYLPLENVCNIVSDAGFVNIRHKASYSGLAFIVACEKEEAE